MADFAYPHLHRTFSDESLEVIRSWTEKRAILSPNSSSVDQINECCINLLPGKHIIYQSADKTVDPDEATRLPVPTLTQ